jgi:hypothetical protein
LVKHLNMENFGMMSSPSELYGGGGGGKKGKKGKKEKKTGLTVYAGGVEKTPTGLSNAFSANEAGLTPEMLMQYAQDFNLPTTSNRAFQEAQLALLQSTPQGQAQLQRMVEKYGMPKAGTYADDILGVRTQALIKQALFPPKGTKKYIVDGVESTEEDFLGAGGGQIPGGKKIVYANPQPYQRRVLRLDGTPETDPDKIRRALGIAPAMDSMQQF